MFYKTFHNNFEITYRFIIVLLEIMGFDFSQRFPHKNKILNKNVSINKSMEILPDIFLVMSQNDNSLDTKLNEVIFSNFIQEFSKSILSIALSNNFNCINFLKYALKLNPLMVEPLLKDIFTYLLVVDKNGSNNFEELIQLIFQIFAKLHRIQNFIAKLVPSLKSVLVDKVIEVETIYNFYGSTHCKEEINKINFLKLEDDFLTPILKNFTKCILPLASWQVTNLFKTLLFHLEDVVNTNFNDVIKGKL